MVHLWSGGERDWCNLNCRLDVSLPHFYPHNSTGTGEFVLRARGIIPSTFPARPSVLYGPTTLMITTSSVVQVIKMILYVATELCG
jgi:hypothetical protein